LTPHPSAFAHRRRQNLLVQWLHQPQGKRFRENPSAYYQKIMELMLDENPFSAPEL